jgi:hypothetical protein
MSVIATAVKHLMAAGVTGDALLAAIEDIEAQLANEPKPRSAGAIRQARYEERKRQKASEMTKTDVSDENDASDTAEKTEASYRVTPVSPKGDTAPTGAKRNRGMKIGEDWAPPSLSELGPEFRTLAEQWTDASYRTEAAAFRSYWLAETGVKASKSNWKRAWENRIAQIHGKVMREQRFARPPPMSSGNDLVSSILGKQTAHAP